MKTLTKSLVAGALLASSVGLVTAVAAMPYGDGPGCGRGGHHMSQGRHFGGHSSKLERMADRLSVTDEQRTEIRAIADGSRQQMVELRDEMRANRVQLRELTRQTPLDEAAVRSIADKQGDLKAEMIVLRARQRSEVKAVLTDEQRAQMDEMRERKHARAPGK